MDDEKTCPDCGAVWIDAGFIRHITHADACPKVKGCDKWQDEIEDDVCACGEPDFLHPWRCPPRDGVHFDPAPENPERCDACGYTRAEHEPGARPPHGDPHAP